MHFNQDGEVNYYFKIMIILRDKTFSTKKLQALRRLKEVGNRVMTGIDNASLRATDAVMGTKGPKAAFRFKPKSKVQLNRETIATKNKIDSAAMKVATNPGGAASDVIRSAAENPITTVGAVLPAPTTIPAMTAERSLKTNFPRYKRVTEAIGRGYQKYAAPVVTSAGNTAYNTARILC
jgi:hypothetical protein